VGMKMSGYRVSGGVVAVVVWIAVGAWPAVASVLPEVGVTFTTEDETLQRLYDAAEEAEKGNIVQFTPDRKLLVEGGGYLDVWLETQAMGGAMYGKRNLKVALENQLIFMDCQRADGRLPGVIRGTEVTLAHGWDKSDARLPPGHVYVPELKVTAYYAVLQSHCFPSPALDVYYLIGRDKQYLERLYRALERYDDYLWRTRDSNGDGILELWCVYDNGEDNSTRCAGEPHCWPYDEAPRAGVADRPVPEGMRMPYQSMDVMGWSYEGRRTLAEISAELGNGKEAYWQERADDVRQRLVRSLWRPEKCACYDRDKDGRFMDVLLHNNLRCMWFRAFTQEMADQFVQFHLLNPDEFWTPMPLPSIAANDPLFRNARGNNWSGQPQGLTFQRAIRAMENYGHFAELTRIGETFLRTVGKTRRFRQQYDPFTGEPDDTTSARADYGPTALAVLEYLSRIQGIHIHREQVLWSGLARGGHAVETTQRWGKRRYTLEIANGQIIASVNGRERFRATAGVRVVTDVDGRAQQLVGISPKTETVLLQIGEAAQRCEVPPNTVWTVHENGPPTLTQRVPFELAE